MKIVYSAGNRPGSQRCLIELLNRISAKHTVKIAGWYQQTNLIPNISWTLDSLDNIELRSETLAKLKQDIIEFAPDLIISDGELYLAKIATELNITLWCVSSLWLYPGLKWEYNQLSYLAQLEELDKFLTKFPESLKLIYSPFGDVSMRPILRNGFQWIAPFSHYPFNPSSEDVPIVYVEESSRAKVLLPLLENLKLDIPDLVITSSFEEYLKELNRANWCLISGETHVIAEAIYRQKSICVIPNLKDWESILNAILIRSYSFGQDLGQAELMDKYAPFEFLRSYRSRLVKPNYLSIQSKPTLDKLIEELSIKLEEKKNNE